MTGRGPPHGSDGAWRPTTDLAMLRARAALLSGVRAFFAERGVVEVETPLLAPTTNTDPHLDSFAVSVPPHEWYLQNSPEFAMKRLLADGAGAIYQISKAFRRGEIGARHNFEFTMLEWYRPGFALDTLMDEVADLIGHCLAPGVVERVSYGTLFHRYTGLDPHRASLEALAGVVARQPALRELHITEGDEQLARGQLLDLLFSHLVEPELSGAWMVDEFPACQAALARIAEDGTGCPVARRFELFVDGMELANGYDELLDPEELAHRFVVDNRQRALLGKEQLPHDELLLAAMRSGLPECSGVALGMDRLLMLVTGAGSIREVVSFPASVR